MSFSSGLAGGIKAGAAFVGIYLDDRELERGLKTLPGRMRAFGAKMERMGHRMGMTAMALAVPFAAGAKIYANFTQQMANVATMLDDTGKQMEVFSSQVRKMSVAFGESTETLAGGLYEILSASIDAADALDVLEVAVKAAKTGMTDAHIAADALTTIINSFGFEAKDAARVADVMFQTVRRGKIWFAELAGNIGLVAPTAALAGIRLEEMMAALTTMTRAGVATPHSVVALNNILATFLRPMPGSQDAFKRATGLDLNLATLQADGLLGVIEKIQHLSAPKIAQIFPTLRAMRGAAPLAMMFEGFSGDVEAMLNSAGVMETQWAKVSGTLAMSFARAAQAGKLLLSFVGEALADSLTETVLVIVDWAKSLGEWTKLNKEWVAWIAKTIAILGVLAIQMIVVGKAITMVVALMAVAGGPLTILLTLAGIITSMGIVNSLTRDYGHKLRDAARAAKDINTQMMEVERERQILRLGVGGNDPKKTIKDMNELFSKGFMQRREDEGGPRFWDSISQAQFDAYENAKRMMRLDVDMLALREEAGEAADDALVSQRKARAELDARAFGMGGLSIMRHAGGYRGLSVGAVQKDVGTLTLDENMKQTFILEDIRDNTDDLPKATH